jgi:hypothetical protein
MNRQAMNGCRGWSPCLEELPAEYLYVLFGGRMTLYSFALFVHILGALALFGAMGLEWAALLNLRRVGTAEQAREWLKVFALFPRIYPFAWGAILLAGLYMTAVVWKGAGWIIVALVSVVLLMAVGGALAARRMPSLAQGVARAKGALSTDLQATLRDPYLLSVFQVRLAFTLGIVFLMVTKPGLLAGLLEMGVATLLGLLSTQPLRGAARQQEAARAGD